MVKRLIMACSLVCILLLLAACGQKDQPPTSTPAPTQQLSTATSTPQPTATSTSTSTPTETPTVTPTETPAPVVYGPKDFPSDVNPLTGLQVSDPAILNRRPVAVKINIVPRTTNRPPWGISFADIVYDYYHNAGYNRFHAIFYGSDAELVGPIRSARLLDNELVRMYQSLLAYGFADENINTRLLNSEYANRLVLEGQRVDCPPTAQTPLCRYEPSGSDFLLGSTLAITEYARGKGITTEGMNLTGMYFTGLPAQGGAAGKQVYVRYSGDEYTRWDYDPASGKYLRFQDNVYDQGQGEEYAPLLDRLTNQQIAAENVVVLYVRHEYFRQPPGEIIDILLSGTGKAYAFRDGQVYEVTWNRANIYSVLSLTFSDGSPYPLKPGKTWYQVIGQTSTSSQPLPDSWRFQFVIP
jgi:hypothetical protein